MYSRVVVFDTVNVVLHIYSEGDSIQTLITHHTAEAARVVGLPKGLEDLRRQTTSRWMHDYMRYSLPINRCVSLILNNGSEKSTSG